MGKICKKSVRIPALIRYNGDMPLQKSANQTQRRRVGRPTTCTPEVRADIASKFFDQGMKPKAIIPTVPISETYVYQVIREEKAQREKDARLQKRRRNTAA